MDKGGKEGQGRTKRAEKATVREVGSVTKI